MSSLPVAGAVPLPRPRLKGLLSVSRRALIVSSREVQSHQKKRYQLLTFAVAAAASVSDFNGQGKHAIE